VEVFLIIRHFFGYETSLIVAFFSIKREKGDEKEIVKRKDQRICNTTGETIEREDKK
jgi:hypothetical protein